MAWQRIAIVGSGASLRGFGFGFGRGVFVIAVNGGLDICIARADAFFTLDLSNINRMRLNRALLHGIKSYVALAPGVVYPSNRNLIQLERITGCGHGRFRTKGGLCPRADAVHTGNSAWGAFQVAAAMRPAAIGLFGIDGFGGYASGSGAPRDLSMLPDLFSSAVDELAALRIAVVNGSPESRVECFPRMSPEAAREWLERYESAE